MNRIGAFAKRHGSDAVVLRHYDIVFSAQINQGKINGVCPRANDFYLAVLRAQHMVRIAQQRHWNTFFSGCLLYNPDYRAGVRVHIDFHCTLSFLYLFVSYFVDITIYL